MREFSPGEIEQTKGFIESSQFVQVDAVLDNTPFSYFVLPQTLNPALADFAIRLTRTDPQSHDVSGIFGVSDNVPEHLRDYWAFHEVYEFMTVGIETEGRCATSEKKIVEIIPEDLKDEYLERRSDFFRNLIVFFQNEIQNGSTDYSEDDVREAQATLQLLDGLQLKPGTWSSTDIKESDTHWATERLKHLQNIELEVYESDSTRDAYETFAITFSPTVDVIYYPGSSTDITPSTFPAFNRSRIIYTDLDERAIKVLQQSGYEAYTGNADEYDPGLVDLVLLFNFYAEKPTTVVKPGGYILCNDWWGAATHLHDNPEFELAAIIRQDMQTNTVDVDQEGLHGYWQTVETDEEFENISPDTFLRAKKVVSEMTGKEENIVAEYQKLHDEGYKIYGVEGFGPDGTVLHSLPRKKDGGMFVFRKK